VQRQGDMTEIPDGGPQTDLLLDSMVERTWRGDRALLEFPFFSLQKTPRFDPIVYDDGVVSITVSPGKKGIATIWDKDILFYITSLINDRIEQGDEPTKTILFSARDCLKTIGRDVGGRGYEEFKDALFRLRSTTIETTIQSDGDTEDRGFGWVDSWRIVSRVLKDGSRQMEAVEVVINDWMYRAIVKERRVLSIDPDYFKLSMGIERRIYEIARKHLGRQPQWSISMTRLAEKVGTERALRNFRIDLNKIIEKDAIPSYTMRLADPNPAGRPNWAKIMVVFEPRKLVHKKLPSL
jgi:plasmid replication initiation protein